MRKYATRSKSTKTDSTDLFETSPFRVIHELGFNKAPGTTYNHDSVVKGATRILERAQRDGTIESDGDVVPHTPAANSYNSREMYYYRFTAPTASTVDGLVWNSSFRLKPDAPRSDGREFQRQLSRLKTPKADFDYKSAIRSMYLYLEGCRDKDNRATHPRELHATAFTDLREYELKDVCMYVAKLPGVDPPVSSKPAWEVVDTLEVEENATTEETP